MALTQVSDVIVPSIFARYVQQMTEEKSRLIASGAVVRDAAIDGLLAGGGKTFDVPSWKDLSASADNVSADDAFGANDATPVKTGTAQETAVRLSRNQVWSSADLAAALAGADPMMSIADRVAYFWTRRQQAAFVATVKGILADNAASPTGGDTHTQNDMTVDISGSSFTDGVTNFSAESFIDAALTMGDSMENLKMIFVHSVVYGRMQKNNLIDFIPDSEGRVTIPTFLGREVIIDDAMPVSSGVYESWLFGAGAFRLGVGSPKVPVEIDRKPEAGNGGGEERLHSRVEWCIHPVGHRYIGTAPSGGPANTSSSNMLAAAGSWSRTFPERKQIKIARLITRES